MNTLKINIYTIDELSEEARQKAIKKHQDFLAED